MVIFPEVQYLIASSDNRCADFASDLPGRLREQIFKRMNIL
jgi:hypothetical protein